MEPTTARTPLIGSICSGYGGLDLGVQTALGGTLAWHAEINPDAARILARRWPGVPNLRDITAVDWADVPRVCVLTAGFRVGSGTGAVAYDAPFPAPATSIRACGSPAHGFPTSFTGWHAL
ncbi:DNA cytosine methyltransferase [Streptomyces sp. WMMC940]|uniref:DNA cytosine methyltransferase n=1 Tax=Streptomyces sp. WMMC940 TaxID=3015153 RepID=UPI0022B72AA1|nr:DNA cytosine methyltransferase [Streptomyces sp. WMMC940]MCZ7460628.1 DNA cytosine methyltransferase [Streptomyces sp. WMMC940]